MALFNADDEINFKPEMVCKYCGKEKRKNCDGEGWLEPIGPKADGSYITSRRCYNAR